MGGSGDLAQLEPGRPQDLTFRRIRVDGWKVESEKATAWVVKISDREVVAFSPWCTHLGCAYHWDAQKEQFLCPCHGLSPGSIMPPFKFSPREMQAMVLYLSSLPDR